MSRKKIEDYSEKDLRSMSKAIRLIRFFILLVLLGYLAYMTYSYLKGTLEFLLIIGAIVMAVSAVVMSVLLAPITTELKKRQKKEDHK